MSSERNGWYVRTGKRISDLVLGVLMLVALSPILAIAAVSVWVALGNPILFKQERAGVSGRPFTILKFRSMLPQRDGSGTLLTEEQRLTSFGAVLRRTSLDELPELWNVVRGDMSLVGPRPLLMRYNERYSDVQARRLSVRPGLTGWAQIHGRNETTWSERLDRDVWYVDHVSPLLDLSILLRSVPVVIRGKGVSPRDEPFMPEFEGENGDRASNHRPTS